MFLEVKKTESEESNESGYFVVTNEKNVVSTLTEAGKNVYAAAYYTHAA